MVSKFKETGRIVGKTAFLIPSTYYRQQSYQFVFNGKFDQVNGIFYT